MSEEVKSVADLRHVHIGKRLRVQSLDGGYIEGTLAGIRHRVMKPYGPQAFTWLAFEEFGLDFDGSEKRDYIWFMTYENRVAQEIDE
jgi:hypothetical protein